MSMAHHLSDDEFTQIYQKYFKMVRNICYSGVFFNQEIAEELTDDVFMVLLNKSERVEPDKYESYLVSVAERKVKEARRAHVRRPPSADVDEYAEILPEAGMWCMRQHYYDEPEIAHWPKDREKLKKQGRIRMYGTALTRKWMALLGVKTHYVTANGTQTILL